MLLQYFPLYEHPQRERERKKIIEDKSPLVYRITITAELQTHSNIHTHVKAKGPFWLKSK